MSSQILNRVPYIHFRALLTKFAPPPYNIVFLRVRIPANVTFRASMGWLFSVQACVTLAQLGKARSLLIICLFSSLICQFSH